MDAHCAVNGFYDFEFTLFDSPDPNVMKQVGNKIDVNNIEVTNGFLNVDFDFGSGDPNVFNGNAKWIESIGWPIGINHDEFNTVSRFEEIKPVPYSLLSQGIFGDINRNVGIGTTRPGAALDVNGIFKIGPDTKSLLFFTDGAGEDIRSTNTLHINYNNNQVVDTGHSGSSDLYVSGNLGIGTVNPIDKLHAVGSSFFDLGSGSISISTPDGSPGLIAFSPNGYQRNIIFDDSSIRLKDVGDNFERGLAEVSELNPIWYNYSKDNELHLDSDTKFVGVVAQEVQKVIPEAVEKSDSGCFNVNNDPIIWAMVNAIKELKAENEELKKKVNELEKKLQ